VTRAASQLCDTQTVFVTNYTFDGWIYKSNFINDVLDGGRTNRFETRYYWIAVDPTNYAYNTNAIACYWYVTNAVIEGDQASPCTPNGLTTQDDDPVFSAVTLDTVATNSLTPWDGIYDIVGFYPTGETRFVDGYTNGAGDPQGDLYLTIASYDPVSAAWLTYSNDLIYDYFYQVPVYSQTVAALNVQHSNTWTLVCDWATRYPTGMPMKVFTPEYTATIALSNSVTNAWIMQWEPVIRWDVAGGMEFITP
jgi:hypothetical protein